MDYKILMALRTGEVNQLRDLLQETDPGDIRLKRKDLMEIRNLAFKANDSDILHSLLSKFDKSTNKDALLIRALRDDKIDIIKMLSRDKDLDVNALKSARLGTSSALMFAKSPEALEFLLTGGGADLKKLDRSGQQFLQEAVRSKSCEFIEAMIKNGANVNMGAERGEETPLILATKLRRTQVMAVLIDNGADMHYVTSDRRTALTCASKKGIQLLIKKGLNPQTVATSLGLLHAELYLTCCENACPSCISKVWPVKPDVHEKDNQGQTLLIKAARRLKLSWVNFALANGGDIYAKDKHDHNIALRYLTTNVSNFAQTNPEFWDNYKVLWDKGKFACYSKPYDKWATSHSVDLDHRKLTYMVMQSIFDAGGTMYFSHLCSWAFIEALQANDLSLVKGIAQSHMVPVLYRGLPVYPDHILDQTSRFKVQVKRGLPMASPLMVALAYCSRQVVYDIIDNVFLTKYDLHNLPRVPILVKVLDEVYRAFLPVECKKKDLPSRIVKKVFRQPFSLMKLAFITVSTRLGNHKNRESLVNSTGLPKQLRDMLLFKGLSVAAEKWSRPLRSSWEYGYISFEEDNDDSDDD